MNAKKVIIIGVALILISIVLFFLAPLFVSFCGVPYSACIDTVTGKDCPRDSFPSIFNVNCVDFYRNLASILFIIGIFFIVAGLIEFRKKDWKEFLSFCWRKIVISIVIFLIFPLPVYTYSGGCVAAVKFPDCRQYLTIKLSGLRLFDPIVHGFIFVDDLIFLLAVIVSSYILSCVIVSAYDKLKTKK